MGGPIAFAEDLFVGRCICAHLMIVDEGTSLRQGRVVKAALIGHEGESAVTGPRKTVRKVLARINVHQPRRYFVLAALADAVGDSASVLRDANKVHAGGM